MPWLARTEVTDLTFVAHSWKSVKSGRTSGSSGAHLTPAGCSVRLSCVDYRLTVCVRLAPLQIELGENVVHDPRCDENLPV
jgi:hypothetical protein